MRNYSYIYLITGLFFFIAQHQILGQQTKKFTYRGKSSKGTVQIQYMLQIGNRVQKLKGSTIDLNKYGGNVKLIVQFSDLRLGLNNAFTGVRNSDHPRAFYMEVSYVKMNTNVLIPISSDVLKISAKGGHYGPLSGSLVYRVNNVNSGRKIKLLAKAEIVDGIYNRRWLAANIIKQFTILPKKVSPETKLWRQAESLWVGFQENPDPEDRKALLEKCAEYQKGCADGTFKCRYEEDVLYYMIVLNGGDMRKQLIAEYRDKYRKGKYLEAIAEIPEPPEPDIPIDNRYSRIDFDKNYLIVNGIKGGKQPYFVKFFDYEKNEQYPLESRRFTREETQLKLASIPVPEGNYLVKITDAKDKIFIEKDKVYINKTIQLSSSIKLGVILLFLGGLAFLYKKYIHF